MSGLRWDELENAIKHHSLLYASGIYNIKDKTPVINAWWNLYNVNNHHCWHSHSGSLMSGTFYVHVDDDSVGIEFKSPLESLILAHSREFGYNTRWEQAVELTPETGDLLIWPSWLEHTVPEQKTVGDNLRCSISFNVNLR